MPDSRIKSMSAWPVERATTFLMLPFWIRGTKCLNRWMLPSALMLKDSREILSKASQSCFL